MLISFLKVSKIRIDVKIKIPIFEKFQNSKKKSKLAQNFEKIYFPDHYSDLDSNNSYTTGSISDDYISDNFYTSDFDPDIAYIGKGDSTNQGRRF